MIKDKRNSKSQGSPGSRCESCVFFEYDEDFDDDICTLNLDEDEFVRYLSSPNRECPYYRYYDEYKSVQKQN